MGADARSFVGGRWIDGSGDARVRQNPASGEHVSEVKPIGHAELEDAIEAATSAAASWATLTMHDRAVILETAAGIVEERQKEFADLLTREEGKPLAESTAETARSARILQFFASEADRPTGELFASPRDGELVRVERRPLGVVGMITPWNFPIAIPMWKLAPALIYGNTVVWKPASPVPALSTLIMEVFAEAGIPAGVLNLVHCNPEVASTMVSSPALNGISFTGSTAVGSHIIAEAARNRTPVQAEMGGKNTAIVLPDANMPLAVDSLVEGAMGSTGQRCTATERLLVHASIADGLVEDVCAGVAALRVGDGRAPETQIGPVVTARAQADIRAAIARADDSGAELRAQARMDIQSEGSFVMPTVLEIDDTSTEIWQEEVFGPVLAVKRFDTYDEALAIANDTPYGLSASLFTNDHSAMERAVDEIAVGVLHINGPTIGADPHVPFGGRGASGYGPKEQGRAAREFFTESRTVYQRSATSSHG